MTQDHATSVPGDKRWEEAAKNMLKAEMTRQGVSYAILADRLGEFGVIDNELNLRNKVSRGRFTAVFLLQCLAALDTEWVKIPALADAFARDRSFKGSRMVEVDFSRPKADAHPSETSKPLGKTG